MTAFASGKRRRRHRKPPARWRSSARRPQAVARARGVVALVPVELSREEALELLRLVKARHFEVERMLQNLEETEGLDATKWQARRTLLAQAEVAQDLVVKLEEAVRPRTS